LKDTSVKEQYRQEVDHELEDLGDYKDPDELWSKIKSSLAQKQKTSKFKTLGGWGFVLDPTAGAYSVPQAS